MNVRDVYSSGPDGLPETVHPLKNRFLTQDELRGILARDGG
jgi:hypothetical protein